jgi:hypothetical protein
VQIGNSPVPGSMTTVVDTDDFPSGDYTYVVEAVLNDDESTVTPRSNERTVTVVRPANHAPEGTNKAWTIGGLDAIRFTLADFGFTDPNDAPPNALLAVRITTVVVPPDLGGLYLSDPGGEPVLVTAGTFVSRADIEAGRLKFAAFQLPGVASFTFQVQDDGGTENGGVDLDPTPNVMTITVVAD